MTGARKDNFSATAAVLAGLSLTLSGCVVLETESKGSEPSASSSPSSAAPAESKSSEDSTPSDGQAVLLDTDADYARAIQAFSPRLVHWSVDGDAITYSVRSCTSPKPTSYTGKLGPENPEWNDRREITWNGDEEPRLDSYVIVTDDYLVEEVDAGDDDSRAVTDIEGQNTEWLSKCKDLV